MSITVQPRQERRRGRRPSWRGELVIGDRRIRLSFQELAFLAEEAEMTMEFIIKKGEAAAARRRRQRGLSKNRR